MSQAEETESGSEPARGGRRTAMTITYTYRRGLYVNLTNRCPQSASTSFSKARGTSVA